MGTLIQQQTRMASSVSSKVARQVASKVLKQQRSELSSLAKASTAGKNRQEQHKKEQDNGSERTTAWTGLGLLGAGLAFSAQALLAEEVKTRKVVEEKREKKVGKSQEDRIRQHATAD